MRYRPRPRIDRIVSGGQTGADRAALDWAIDHGVDHGGWCPRGRRAEDGVIDARYRLVETPGERYEERTEANVRDSDATVIFTLGAALTGGSRRTAELAEQHGKPWLRLTRSEHGERAGDELGRFVAHHGAVILNVAGPRASHEPGIEAFVTETLTRAFGTP